MPPANKRVFSIQGRFKVRVKAHEYVGGEHVCNLPKKEQQGVIHVKPSSSSESLKIDASIICDVCPCEQVWRLHSAHPLHFQGEPRDVSCSDTDRDCHKSASVHEQHCPPLDGILTAYLCVICPLQLPANGDSPLAQVAGICAFRAGILSLLP